MLEERWSYREKTDRKTAGEVRADSRFKTNSSVVRNFNHLSLGTLASALKFKIELCEFGQGCKNGQCFTG